MKKLGFSALVLGALALTAALGFVAGRRTALAPIRSQLSRDLVNTLRSGNSLADVIPPERRAGASACFLDGAAVASRFDEIAWAPPAVPTPFVGFGPRPGRHLNAFVTPLQLRAERDPIVPKPTGRTRVLLVGGSVAFGSGAPSQDRTVGAYLERLLGPGVEVFTLAYPWWTTTHERIAIEQRAALLEPDLVLVISGANDVAAAARGVDVRWSRTPVDALYFERLDDDFHLAGLPPLVDVAPAPAPGAAAPPPDLVAERVKANVLLEAQAAGGKLRWVLQPTLLASKKPLTAREKELGDRTPTETSAYGARCFEEIRGALGGTGFFLDATDAFDSTKEDVYLDLVHVADRGDELLARRIAAALQR